MKCVTKKIKKSDHILYYQGYKETDILLYCLQKYIFAKYIAMYTLDFDLANIYQNYIVISYNYTPCGGCGTVPPRSPFRIKGDIFHSLPSSC